MIQCVAGVKMYQFCFLKQRKNPFDSEVIASHTVEEKDCQVLEGAGDLCLTLNDGESLHEHQFVLF